MTDIEQKALVEALKRYTLTYNQRWKLVDLIETQAREIERLRAALEGISAFGARHPGHGYSCHTLARAALAGDSHDQ